jgi:hypothetical protein
MLAVFNGTDGTDMIEIRRGSDGLTHVRINGGATQDTSDIQVIINALGGNDSVYFPELRNFNTERRLQLFLGDGNDLASNYDPVTQTASLDALDYAHELMVEINAGAGNDTLELDGTDSTLSRVFTFESTPEPTQAIVRLSDPGSQGFLYNSQLETCVIEGTPSGDIFRLDNKLDSLQPIVSGFDGSDSFFVGGGSMEFGGWFMSNITVSGGAGSDFIRFDNQSDGQLATEPYTFDVFKLTKGAGEFSYNSFESQTFRAPNVNSGSNTINVTAFSGQIESTLIDGGSTRSNTINFGDGNFTGLSGTTSLNLRGPADVVNFNAQSATGPRTFSLSADQLTSPAAVNFTGVEDVNISAGPSADNISITGSAVGTSVGVSGNLGDDLISIGGGDFGNMLSAVAVNGAGGNDFVRFLGNSDPDLLTATLRNNSFITGGLTHSYINFETVDIQIGPGGSDLTIQSVPFLTLPAISLTNVTGGDGDDQITIGTGNVLVGGNVTVSGSSGNDTLVLNDSSGASNSTYTFDQGNRFLKTSAAAMFTVVRSGFEQTILEASGGNNAITVDRTTSPLTIRSNGGNDTVNVLDSTVPVTVNTGGENVSATAPFGDSIAINTDFAVAGDTAATVLVDQTDAVLGLTVAQQGTLRMAQGGVLDKLVGTGSTFTLTGTLDLAGGALLSRAGGPTPAAFRSQIITGRNGGAWNGTSAAGAINSSMAAGSTSSDGVGYGLGSQIALASIGGFSIAAADTLLRYTHDGDADLGSGVNLADFNRLAANFGQSNRAWVDGDSTYDGMVNLADFNGLAGNFGQAVAAPALFAAQSVRRINDSDDRREILEQLT